MSGLKLSSNAGVSSAYPHAWATTVMESPCSYPAYRRCRIGQLQIATEADDMQAMWMLNLTMRMDIAHLRTNADAYGSQDAYSSPLSLSTSPGTPNRTHGNWYIVPVVVQRTMSYEGVEQALPLSRYGMNGFCRTYHLHLMLMLIVVHMRMTMQIRLSVLFHILRC